MKDWTFMIYMAGDNGKMFDSYGQLMGDLQSFGWNDLREMSEVGSTDRISIVAQFDTMANDQYTPRFFIDGSKPAGQLVAKLDPVNTGDPKNLTDFIVWGETTYPARNYALVLWNHGTGWKEDDIYARFRDPIDRAGSRGETRAGSTGQQLRSSLFVTTAGQIMSIEDEEARGICYDDSSMDFLDNQDLVNALKDAEEKSGQRLALLGMDACLMSMVEVAYQVRDHADVMVGSQENEPGSGWPYTSVLRALADNPSMTARALGQHIVQAYGQSHSETRSGGGSTTQSAIDLGQMLTLGETIDRTARVLISTMDNEFQVERAVFRSQKSVQRFRGDTDFMDLSHFLTLVSQDGPLSSPVLDSIDQLQQAVTASVIANYSGLERRNAHGLSAYFPNAGCSQYYVPDRLAFAGLTWRNLILKVNQMT